MRKSPSAFFSAPILFFLFSEKEKNRRSVRRSLLHSASAGAAKAPYSQSPSSSPKGNRFAGLPFGFVGADDAVGPKAYNRRVIANRCAHWCGNPVDFYGVLDGASFYITLL